MRRIRLIGAIFALVLLISLITGVATTLHNPPAELASEVFHQAPKELHLQSDGQFGTFDRRQLQRGFQVYSEVCNEWVTIKEYPSIWLPHRAFTNFQRQC